MAFYELRQYTIKPGKMAWDHWWSGEVKMDMATNREYIEFAGEMGFRAGLHNHMGQIVQTADEVDRCMALTDPKLFWFSPDTAHLYLAKCDPAYNLEKYKSRLMMMDYKDARFTNTGKFTDDIFDLGDGDIDFPACHKVLKSINYKGWICVDLDTARKGPRASYERSGAYVVSKLESIHV